MYVCTKATKESSSNEELQKIYLKHFFHMKVTMNKIVNFKKL
jgi:hypothetical protein